MEYRVSDVTRTEKPPVTAWLWLLALGWLTYSLLMLGWLGLDDVRAMLMCISK